jgi:pimeloyl-ACP methyl ester carboxylesterase
MAGQTMLRIPPRLAARRAIIAGIVTSCCVCTAIAQAEEEDATPQWQQTIFDILNDPRLQAAQDEAKAWLRDQVVTEEDLANFGLTMEEGWERKDSRRRVVILVHGFQSKAENATGLLHSAREDGYPCGNFVYPNDDLLGTSARLLAAKLSEFAKQHPGRKVALVCHSMGGVVARACLENPDLDPGNVDRLIMIAPPNHGSMLAYAAPGADAWEHIIGREDGLRWEQIRRVVVDGMGDAAFQLRPDSEFLQQLNARPRNPSVKYTIVLGTKAVMSEEEMGQIRTGVRQTLGDIPLVREHVGQVDDVLADMHEVVHGKGDGAVAVSRGQLDGVDDTTVLAFDHLGVVGTTDNDVVHRVHEIILERLK